MIMSENVYLGKLLDKSVPFHRHLENALCLTFLMVAGGVPVPCQFYVCTDDFSSVSPWFSHMLFAKIGDELEIWYRNREQSTIKGLGFEVYAIVNKTNPHLQF